MSVEVVREEGHDARAGFGTRGLRQSFWDQQDANRRKLRGLLVSFFLVTGAAGWFAGAGFEHFRDPTQGVPGLETPPRPIHRDYRYLMTATALLLGFAHMRRLRRCGDLVILGFAKARPLRDRQFENVAQEMAIAAALPTPRLWIVEDAALNAFAIGWDERHASIAITRGLLDQLDRDELQAVIAHEIAHIRNGDAKLMTLLLGMTRAVHVLAPFALGPLGAFWMIGTEGDEEETSKEPRPPAPASPWGETISLRRFLLLLVATPFVAIAFLVVSVVISLTLVVLFAALFVSMPVLAAIWAFSELVRDPSDRRTELIPGLDPRWALALTPCGLILGPAILVVGLVAPLSLLVFRLAISRNQELDADAGAVELTRNPAGLLSALQKLARAERRGTLPGSVPRLCLAPAPASEETPSFWRTLFSTHPPLEERIRRVEMMGAL